MNCMVGSMALKSLMSQHMSCYNYSSLLISPYILIMCCVWCVVFVWFVSFGRKTIALRILIPFVSGKY